MLRSSYKVATVWGIPIKIHISLVILLLIFAMDMGRQGGVPAIMLLLAIELGIFTSIALHELGHSFVAIRKGCRVREITLMFIGGAARMESIPSRPRDELQMAIAGPIVSLVLGALFYTAGRLLLSADVRFLGNVFFWVGTVNFFLAGFNLLPAFPMDGGRVLRALLTPKMGRVRATFIAARLGKIMAILFGIYGFISVPTKWILVAIAFFIYTATGGEYRMVQVEEMQRRGEGFGGIGFWPFAGTAGSDPEAEEQVEVGPPPYGGPRRIHTDLYEED